MPNGINTALSLWWGAEPSDLRVSPFILLLSSRLPSGVKISTMEIVLKSLKSCCPAWNRRGLASVTKRQLLSSCQAWRFQPSQTSLRVAHRRFLHVANAPENKRSTTGPFVLWLPPLSVSFATLSPSIPSVGLEALCAGFVRFIVPGCVSVAPSGHSRTGQSLQGHCTSFCTLHISICPFLSKALFSVCVSV